MRYGTASNFSKVTIVFVTSSSSVIVSKFPISRVTWVRTIWIRTFTFPVKG